MNSENEFFNKNIVVVGASSGIGQCAATYFLNCGANVALIGNDVETMKNLCQNKFKNAIIIKANLEKDMEIFDFRSSVIERLHGIDVLINAAGIKLDGDVEKTYPQDFDFTVDINLRSVFLTIKIFEGFFKQGASIINISCLYGTRPMYGVMSYAMSKAGLETLTKYAAADFASIGVRINAITSCPVDTNSFRYLKISENEINNFNKKMEKYIPLGRIARPDDIVKVIIFLASKRSKKITGQIIKVDGGRSLTSSGYVHYRGLKNMNSRFEPDSPKISTWIGQYFNNQEKMENCIEDKEKLKKFIQENIVESNFSTRLSDAHKNINCSYKIVDANEDLLKKKYLKGSSPNKLLDKKGMTQSKMSYNEGQLPIQLFPETKSSLIVNKGDFKKLNDIKEVQDEKIINDNIINDN